MKKIYTDIYDFCEKNNIVHYTVNTNGTIEAHSDVTIHDENIKKLPYKFSTVYGNFFAYTRNLTTLENMPETVTLGFTCEGTKITSLKGAPKFVGSQFSVYGNHITSLDYFPDTVGTHLYLQDNPLVFDQKCIDKVKEILSSYKLSYVDLIEDLFDREQLAKYNVSKRLLTIQNIINS